MKNRLWGWIIGGTAIMAAILFCHAVLIWEEEGSPPVIGEVRRLIPLPFVEPTPLPPKERALRALRLLGKEADVATMAEAVRGGSTETLGLLFKAGLSARLSDGKGQPLIIVAVAAGEPESVAMLLEAGADVNAQNAEGLTPLQAAVARGDRELAARLLEAGANLHHHDAAGHGMLHTAVIGGDPEMFAWLRERGLEESGRCCAGERDLVSHALEGGDMAILEPVLAAASEPREWNRESRERLFSAIKEQDKALVRLLLASHAAPPTPEGYRQPLLGYAIVWGQPEVVRLLLECGADPNTPLGSPVEPAFASLVDQKVTRHYLQTEAGMTPLMLAAGLGQLETVQTLLEHGARRGATTKKWRVAALSLAARGNHLDVMQVLLGKPPGNQPVRIEISLASQRASLWKNDRIVYSTRISSGRAGYATAPGDFVITDKHRTRVSNLYNVKMPYFMRLNCSAIGMHAGVVPNYPASHGCIRLPKDAAIRFFRDAEVGTLVTIR